MHMAQTLERSLRRAPCQFKLVEHMPSATSPGAARQARIPGFQVDVLLAHQHRIDQHVEAIDLAQRRYRAALAILEQSRQRLLTTELPALRALVYLVQIQLPIGR